MYYANVTSENWEEFVVTFLTVVLTNVNNLWFYVLFLSTQLYSYLSADYNKSHWPEYAIEIKVYLNLTSHGKLQMETKKENQELKWKEFCNTAFYFIEIFKFTPHCNYKYNSISANNLKWFYPQK